MYILRNELKVYNLHFNWPMWTIIRQKPTVVLFVSRTFAEHYIYAYVCDNLFVQNEKIFKLEPYEYYTPLFIGQIIVSSPTCYQTNVRQSFKFRLALKFLIKQITMHVNFVLIPCYTVTINMEFFSGDSKTQSEYNNTYVLTMSRYFDWIKND